MHAERALATEQRPGQTRGSEATSGSEGCRPQARGMTATGPAIMEVDPGSVAGTAVDRFLDEPLARGLNGETAVDRFLDEPSDWGPAGETLVDRSLDTGVGQRLQPRKMK